MKNVNIYDWTGGIMRLKALGFEHNSVVKMSEEELSIAVKRMFDAGLNVMLAHGQTENDILLAVDTKRFTQR
jgi:hypothetical protein